VNLLRIKISVIGLFLTGMISCNEKPIKLDYCDMISEDQTYVNNDKSDIIKYNADKSKRHEIFKKNFDLIMQKTKVDGFPKTSFNSYQRKDSCKFLAVEMTMIHIAQSNPQMFYSKKYVDIFKSELDKGNIEKRLLKQSSNVTAKTIDLCEEFRPNIEYALKI
jgi:hypothetical protein